MSENNKVHVVISDCSVFNLTWLYYFYAPMYVIDLFFVCLRFFVCLFGLFVCSFVVVCIWKRGNQYKKREIKYTEDIQVYQCVCVYIYI